MTFPNRAATVSVLVLLAAAFPAVGQTTPPAAATPAAPTPAAPTPPAPVPDVPVPATPAAPEVPPEKLAAARAVVISSGMSRSFEPMAAQLEEQIPIVVTRTRPDLSNDLTAILAQLKPEFDKKGEEMIDIAARIYARDMSEDDLKATADFFNSPAGKDYVRAQPVMLDALVVAMQSWTQDMSTYMMKRVQEEMKKRGKTF